VIFIRLKPPSVLLHNLCLNVHLPHQYHNHPRLNTCADGKGTCTLVADQYNRDLGNSFTRISGLSIEDTSKAHHNIGALHANIGYETETVGVKWGTMGIHVESEILVIKSAIAKMSNVVFSAEFHPFQMNEHIF